MSEAHEFDYETFIQQNLEEHPLGRTTEDLQTELPEGRDKEALQDALLDLKERTVVKKIGKKWRWNDF